MMRSTSAVRAVVLALAVVSCATTTRAAVSITLPSPASVTSTANVVQDNFAAISLEFNVLDHLIGPSPSSIPTPIQNYLKAIRSRISQPLRLRVGGNSLDGSFYDPNATQMISFGLASIDAGIKNIPVIYGPQVLTTLNQLASDVGGISHLLGLSLVFPTNDSNVVRFAQDAQKVLGSSLDAFLLGNEPDLYEENHKRPVNYTVANYSVDFNKVVGDLRAGNADTGLGSPSTCCNHPNWGLADVLKETLNSPAKDMLKYASIQHYPQQSCDSTGTNRWNITYFTNHSNVQTLATWQADGVQMARAAGQQVIMDEFNTASCGGEPGRSDTFAAALWTVDFVLGLAANNFTAAYLHTRENGISYDIFNYPNSTSPSNANAASGWKTGPQYYSLILLAEAFSNKASSNSSAGSVVVDLNLPNPTGVAGYAIYDGSALSGSPRSLVLFNYANGTSTSSGIATSSDSAAGSVQFTIPKGLAPNSKLHTTVRMLSASTLNEGNSAKITYAGQSTDSSGSGTLVGKVVEKTIKCSGGCTIEVPGPGVALVQLQVQGASGGAGSRASVSVGLMGVSLCGLLLGCWV